MSLHVSGNPLFVVFVLIEFIDCGSSVEGWPKLAISSDLCFRKTNLSISAISCTLIIAKREEVERFLSEWLGRVQIYQIHRILYHHNVFELPSQENVNFCLQD